jgi:hypothetical protein
MNRLEFARNKIDASREYFQTQYNVIHIDKENFHVDKKIRRVFVGNGEVLPYRSHQNANYIQKVMGCNSSLMLIHKINNGIGMVRKGYTLWYRIILLIEGITGWDFNKEIRY